MYTEMKAIDIKTQLKCTLEGDYYTDKEIKKVYKSNKAFRP